MAEENAAAREQVAAAARRLAGEGLVIGTAGNVSCAVGEDRIAVTASGVVLAEASADSVTIVDRAGSPVDGELQPSSELELHLGVYERYGAGAVVHTHAPMATALACVIDELPCVHYQMLLFGGDVRVAPYRTFGTPELAQVTLDALEGKTAALMANHGAIAYAHDLEHAVEASLTLEWACTIYWRAAQLGEPRVRTQADRQAVIDAVIARSYGTPQPLDRGEGGAG